MPPKNKLLTPDAAFCTTDLTSLLDVVARARREHIGVSEANAPRNPQDLMTLGRIREWFCRDRYVLGEVIAEGGMARIYRAADLHICRTVALKLPAEPRPSPLNLTRFLLEAQITAQLEHPNIIPVHDIGVDPLLGLPFFTMEYVAGLTLREVVVGLRQHDPEIRRLYGNLGERLNIILKAIDAVQFAHSLHVVHRDLKPANIMVGTHGRVYVIDWGIAINRPRPMPAPCDGGRLQFDESRISTFWDAAHPGPLPQDPMFLGSPVHMAPEQFMDHGEVDERTDVYSLGCTLYELVTLHPPFDPTTPLANLLAAKRKGDFLPVWRHLPAVHGDLARIIHKCMEPSCSRRYQSVRQLQAAVKAFTHASMTSRRKLQALRHQVLAMVPPSLSAAAQDVLLRQVDAILKIRPH